MPRVNYVKKGTYKGCSSDSKQSNLFISGDWIDMVEQKLKFEKLVNCNWKRHGKILSNELQRL